MHQTMRPIATYDKRPHRLPVAPRGSERIRPIMTLIQYMVPSVPVNQFSKRHFDRFSCFLFAQLTRVPNTQTHRPRHVRRP